MHKIAVVDLTKEKVKIEKMRNDFVKKWIGGNGFGVNWLLEHNPRKIDPLDSKNTLIFATGPFTATSIPTTGRYGVFSKSPQTNTFCESYSGGHFGSELRYAGFIGLIIKGKSNYPCYLEITDDSVKIREAKSIWGLDTFETEKRVKEQTDKNASVALIGQAGENLVCYSCIQNDFGRQAGRGGMGAVMGSKNLKAISAKGSKDVEVNNFEKIREFTEKWNSMIRATSKFKDDVNLGTSDFIVWMSEEKGCLPTKNFQFGVFDKVKKMDPVKWNKKYKLKNKACFACDKPCGRLFQIKKGWVVEGPEYETQSALGTNCLVSDMKAIAKANYLCDKYGLDTISTGVTIAWSMEAFENKVLTKNDTDNVDLKFGNDEAILKIIPKIAKREGIGKLLSLGSKKASEQVKKGSERYAMQSKGMEFPSFEIRGMKGMGLGFAVSTRGACHLRSMSYLTDLTGEFSPLNIHNMDRFSTQNQAKTVAKMENSSALFDSLIVCKFSRNLFTLRELADLLGWITGFEYSQKSILETGEKTVKKEREFNKREGFTKKDDTLPWRILNEPSPVGKSKDSYISEKELEKMKKEYYGLR